MGEARLNKKGKPSIINWGGITYGSSRFLRIVVLVALVVVIVSLSFMQLGFIGVGAPDQYSGYCVTLLAPVALGALMLGIWPGVLLGIVAGVVIYLHAAYQPLDNYEIFFLAPEASVFLLAMAALTLGLLFALIYRRDRSNVSRVIGVLLSCLLVSLLFTLSFMVDVSIQLVAQYADLTVQQGLSLESNELNELVYTILVQMGDVTIQFVFDALLMFVVCIAGDYAVRRRAAIKEAVSLRTTFRGWLLLMVALAFMVTAAVSFVVITDQAKDYARNNMQDEIQYIIDQLKNADIRAEGLSKFIEGDSRSEKALNSDEVSTLQTLFSINTLLDGYTRESDGVILVLKNGRVLLSDDPKYEPGMTREYYIGDDYIWTDYEDNDDSGAAKVQEEMLQIAYDQNPMKASDFTSTDSLKDHPVTTQIAFMCIGEYSDYSVRIITPSSVVFASRNATMAWTSFSALVLLVVVFLLVSRLLSLVVIGRIDETNGVLAQITGGNLKARVDISDSAEFKSLSTGINTTVDALEDWISEAEKRMDQELATAKAIQESALPRIFPPFPDLRRFDIYASMKAAKEVGGDFYDFFILDDGSQADACKLGFVIADVSGKGVPAALFMMTAKTHVRNYLMSGISPGEAIENVNRQLCDGNDAGMFVTLFAGILDCGTGHVTYVNAGHNPPLLWQGASWRWVTDKSGIPLGLFDGLPYDQFEVDLEIGDMFFLYTDGVTEAMDVGNRLYGEERLEAFLSERFYLHPRRLILEVRHDLALYAQGAEQSDDITMLALEYGVPPELTSTIIVPADTGELYRVLAFVHSELDRRLCPVKAQNQLDIAIEELFVNVAHYAYPDADSDKPGMARVSCTYSADPPSVTVEIADEGIPYNPLEKPDAVTPDDIADVPIGGLGILMAKNSVDEMSYERHDGSNVVTIVKKW